MTGPEVEYVGVVERIEYGLTFGNFDKPTVLYTTEDEARGVLAIINQPGMVVKRTVYVEDWQDVEP